jgi:hypothetical protein
VPLSSREQLILKQLESPKTITELLDHEKIGTVGYYTIRNCIQDLITKGLAQECPWRKGREKQYRAGFFLEDGQTIDKMMFSMFGQAQTAIQIANTTQLDDVYGVAGKILRLAAIKPLWEFLVRNDEDKLKTDGHPSKDLVRERLQLVAENLNSLYQLAEQLLNAPIWDDNNVPALLIGNDPVDDSKLLERLRELEELALSRGW